MDMVVELNTYAPSKGIELILSKQEGGEWGICNVPKKYQPLIVQALDEYLSNKSTEWDENNAREYATYMITQISN